ncbi:DUF4386 domain-containing protein [Euzebya tangerina]|uniref:DUF4386 domain-containing protein n=1 Tax=Euzebya tangerina TaxID=591198 RepID=UPI000E30D6CF|nr:DUF4386 domain-containing protein [Euzebya tangerina]
MTATTTRHPQTTPARGPAADRHRAISIVVGLAYIGIIATGIFAEFVVRGQLLVADDAARTASNILANTGLFQAGIAADLIMVGFDLMVGVGLYLLLRHLDRRLALATTLFRVLQGAVIAVNLLNLTRALMAAQTSAGATAMELMEAHALGYDAGLIAFGFSCLFLARLLWTYRLVPRWLAVGMAATGVVYLVGSAAALWAPSLSAAIDPLYLIAMVVEPAFAVRLIRHGLAPHATTNP